jgi:receptor expression-enhancing protein 1/2/3/4
MSDWYMRKIRLLSQHTSANMPFIFRHLICQFPVARLAFGYAYPAYECYKTVELNKPEIEQLMFWCQYW